MSSNNIAFTKENMDIYLKELAKEFRKLNGKAIPAEIILIGGASILTNYGFRELTYDIDAIISASSAMKEAINHIGDNFNLPNGWLNSDFVKTTSYSSKIIDFSKHYRTFSNILDVRTISAEYLIAMKLMSARQYKNDLSDIVGILLEHQKRNIPISYKQISQAVTDLYGGWDKIPEISINFINRALKNEKNYEFFFNKCREEEANAKHVLIEFEEIYKGVIKDGNVNEILDNLLNHKQEQEKDKPSILQSLKENKASLEAERMTKEKTVKKDDRSL